VVAAFLKLPQQGFELFGRHVQFSTGVAALGNAGGELLALAAYVALVVYLFWDARRATA